MGSKLNRATTELCLDAAFVTSGKYKGFSDFRLASGWFLNFLFHQDYKFLDGTLFAVKVQNSDGYRALFQRQPSDKEWTQLEANAGVKNSGLFLF